MAVNKKKEMGKGIRALLANMDSEPKKKSTKSRAKKESEEKAGVGTIDIDWIEANPYQPRTEFAEEDLEELATSIKTFGVIQPITVRKLADKSYQIISGERRWRASQKAGLEDIPAYIREADDQGMLEIALLENIQRADLNAVEVALSYQRLIDECKLTHELLSDRIGKKRSSITNHLRVLKLPAAVQKALKTKLISLGHAKVLAGVERTEFQLLVLDKILLQGLSVRATENEVAKLLNGKSSNKQTTSSDMLPEIKKIRDQLSEKFGSKVDIARSASGKGTLKIHFGSDNEFNGMIDSILD